jgi:hypothetical protein
MRTSASLMYFSKSVLLFDLSFQFLSYHLLISTCINPFPLSSSISLSLTVPRSQLVFLIANFFYGDRLLVCHPTPNLEGQSTLFITLEQDDSPLPPGTRYPF